MTLRTVRIWPDPVLTQPAVPVGDITAQIAVLANDMLETMYAALGRGLAAPQIGVSKRMFVMDAGWKDGTPTPLVFIDPQIIEVSDTRASGPEGCLSIPGVTAQVERAARARAVWTDETGAQHDRWFDGFDAICVQHENDHLDGILTFDRIDADDAARLKAEVCAKVSL